MTRPVLACEIGRVQRRRSLAEFHTVLTGLDQELAGRD